MNGKQKQKQKPLAGQVGYELTTSVGALEIAAVGSAALSLNEQWDESLDTTEEAVTVIEKQREMCQAESGTWARIQGDKRLRKHCEASWELISACSIRITC